MQEADLHPEIATERHDDGALAHIVHPVPAFSVCVCICLSLHEERLLLAPMLLRLFVLANQSGRDRTKGSTGAQGIHTHTHTRRRHSHT